MSFRQLPFEVLVGILQPLFPPRPTEKLNRPRLAAYRNEWLCCLNLRRISRQLSNVVSRIAIREVQLDLLLDKSSYLASESVKWLLLTKAQELHPENDVIHFLQETAAYLASQDQWDPQKTTSQGDYLNASCEALIAHRGHRWVYREALCRNSEDISLPVDLEIDYALIKEGSLEPISPTHLNSLYGALQIASCQGNLDVVRLLIAFGADVNHRHEMFGYALYGAVHGGHTGVVQFLLECYAEVGISGQYMSILEAAAAQGRDEVLQYLLGTETRRSTRELRNSLLLACGRNHLGSARLLLQHPATDLHFCRRYRGKEETALSVSFENNNKDMVELILRQIDTNQSPKNYRNCRNVLVLAAKNGWFNVVRHLLTLSGIEAEFESGETRHTPLLAAISNGHDDIVRFLIERKDVRPFRFDNDYQPILTGTEFCPLYLAIVGGHVGIASMILNHYGIDPQRTLRHYRSILREACYMNQGSIVRMLLRREDVNPNHMVTENGHTALGTACDLGHVFIVESLLKHEQINVNLPSSGLKPLFIALLRDGLWGHTPIVHMLLRHPKIDVGSYRAGKNLDHRHYRMDFTLSHRPGRDLNQKDLRQAPELYKAVIQGNTQQVKDLLQQEDVDPNCAIDADGEEGASLRRAVLSGDIDVVELLLGRGDIDINAGRSGTALTIAAFHHDTNIMKLLLARPEINTNHQAEIDQEEISKSETNIAFGWMSRWFLYPDLVRGRYGGETAIIYAAKMGRLEVVKLLLEDEKLIPDIPDGCGKTPLWWACRYNYLDIVEALITDGRSDPNVQDVQGWAPFGVAVHIGLIGIVSFLVQNAATLDPNTGSGLDKMTPLHSALLRDRDDVVRALLKHPMIETRKHWFHEKLVTALELARQYNRHEIAETLAEFELESS